MFVELMPLLKERTLFISVARLEGTLKVNVIPTKARGGSGSDHSSELHGIAAGVGCRARQASRQLCRLPCATRLHPSRSQSGNGRGGKSSASKIEINPASEGD